MFSHTTLVCFDLPTLDPRVSGCKGHFVCWHFKRVPVSLADFHVSLADRIPSDFHSQMICECLFQSLVLWAGDPGMGLRPHALQVESLPMRYPSGISVVTC